VKVDGQPAVIYAGGNYLGGAALHAGSNNIPIVAWLGANSTETNRTVWMPPVKPQVFQYDKNGNLTNDSQRLYSWDNENRLVAVETGGTPSPASAKKRSTYLYDAQGRRIQKTNYSGWNGSTYTETNVTGYVWDGWLLLAELNGDGSLSAYHVHGLDLSQSLQGAGGIGGLLARLEGEACYLYTFDGNGNVTDVADTSGTVVAHYEYDPFGRTVSQTGNYADANPWRFSTKQFDDWWGLYYYGRRYYEPSLGRWLSRDPIGEQGGINLFVLVANHPVSGVDARGYGIWEEIWDDIKDMILPARPDPDAKPQKLINRGPNSCPAGQRRVKKQQIDTRQITNKYLPEPGKPKEKGKWKWEPWPADYDWDFEVKWYARVVYWMCIDDCKVPDAPPHKKTVKYGPKLSDDLLHMIRWEFIVTTYKYK
jgi:RHS repeat-associated protein